MGKIRINTIGDASLEKKQKTEAEKRREAKNVEKNQDVILASDQGTRPESVSVQKRTDDGQVVDAQRGTSMTEKKKAQQKSQSKSKKRSPRYIASKKLVDRSKQYSLSDAIDVIAQMQKTKFDETVELHINTIDKGVSGNVTLPYGTGKKTRVAIISPASNAAGAEKLLKDIEAGRIDFDVLIATPDAMPKLAKVAKVLGPKGL